MHQTSNAVITEVDGLRAHALNINDEYLACGLQTLVLLVEVRSVYEANDPTIKSSGTSVTMAEQMLPGFLLFHCAEQLRAPKMHFTRCDRVENPEWRPVSDEHVQAERDLVPVLRPGATRLHESPVQELRCIRASPESDVIDRDASVLKIGRIGEKGAGIFRGIFEISVMIAGAYDLVPKRLLSKPIIERPDILQIISGVHKVAGMNQNISLGKLLYPEVECVGVGNYYHSHALTLKPT